MTNHRIAASLLGLHVGSGKFLFAVAVEVGTTRTPEVLYFGASTVEEVRATLVRNVLTILPKHSRIVGVAPAIGLHHDERGDVLLAG